MDASNRNDAKVETVETEADKRRAALNAALLPTPDRDGVCQIPRKKNKRLAGVDRYAKSAGAAVRRAEVDVAVAGLDAARERAAAKEVTIEVNHVTVGVSTTGHGRRGRKVTRERGPSTLAGQRGAPNTLLFYARGFHVATWWPCTGSLKLGPRSLKAVTLDAALDKVLAAV